MKLAFLLCLFAIASFDGVNSQLWNLISAPYDTLCRAESLPGAWFWTRPCRNYDGTVGCNNRVTEGQNIGVGRCSCNLGEDAYFDYEDTISCVGKVGAVCTSEYTGLIPQKKCTKYADCVADFEGHSIGKCECMYGYVPVENGRCGKDPAIADEDRTTMRTTTTTEAAPRGPLKLPSNVASFGEYCGAQRLNVSSCDMFGRTVSCLPTPDPVVDKTCQCNMGDEDAIFDAELGCVARTGSYCLMRPTSLGIKRCTSGADCFPEALNPEHTFDEGYSFGTCQCLYGYNENVAEGTCIPDPDIPNPSTPRPIDATTPPTTTTDPETTPEPEETTPEAGGREGDGSASTQIAAAGAIIFMSFVATLAI